MQFKVLNERTFAGAKEQTIKVTKQDGKSTITLVQIRKLVNAIEKQAKEKGENIRVMVRGMNATHRFTLKGFDGGLDVQDVEEYFEGTVSDASKFGAFFQLDITIQKEI